MNILKKWTPVLLISGSALFVSWAYGQTTPAGEGRWDGITTEDHMIVKQRK